MNLLNAWAFAEQQGTPLDCHVVIQWYLVDLVAGQSILAAQAKFLDRLSKWLRKRQKSLAYAWTIEFGVRKGQHTHLLLSAGRLHGRDIGELLRSLPKLLIGKDIPLHPDAIRVERTNSPLPHDPNKRARISRTEEQRRGLVSYVCKGLHPHAAMATGINAENQGEVRFRRCGVSRSIDWAARRRAEWTERPLQSFDFADLAEKRRASRDVASKGLSGRPGAPPMRWQTFSAPTPGRASAGLVGASTGLASP